MKRRYLFDSGAAEEFMRNGSRTSMRAATVQTNGGTLGTCTPVLGELCAGFEASQTRDENLKRLARAMSDLILWPYDEKASREFGRVYALLKRIGRPMQQIDVQLAAVASALGNTTIVSMDSDLMAIPGLTVEDWSQPEPTP